MGTENTGSGKWAEKGVPHKGWRCVDIEELEDADQLCEMCEARQIRFVHIMEHDRYPDVLRVGCVCAGHMEQDPVGAQRRETAFKNRRSRRTRWLSRKWKWSGGGNEYLNTDGFNIVVYAKGSSWAARVRHRASGYSRTSKRPYSNSDAAKLAAFDAMIDLAEREPWLDL